MTRLRFLIIIFTPIIIISSCSRRIQCAQVPGTVKVDNSYFIRATELTVREYLEFIVSNDNNPALYPDSTLLGLLPYKFLLDDISKQSNFKYFKLGKQAPGPIGFFLKMKKQGNKEENEKLKSVMFMPITAISYDQAQQYCKWLENKFNSITQKHPVCKVNIALPTIETYKNLIKNKDSICVSNCTSNCNFNFNYNQTKCDNNSVIGIELNTNKLVRCDRFPADNYGIFNLQGNAAEITSEKNISMGGSYIHTAKDSYSNAQIGYTKPEIWLGFRFVVTKYSK
ncbi:SUMF1/EgtB/PvdO family nonheme iron enzyme [Terrimonas pollutisoli]|uniref:SUMF1/EgtB/PvdO family nonheme iron enzyme n=1 Tax=Terrimonas pollutisoli TaxID=3034147 RepID=UPI0023EAB19F|nr:SUMF1/EgtB/PvdO family nonheme iron enzyme [Terrimonas sp. H1YJ31]